jgi:flagellin
MRAQITGLEGAQKNAKDGIGMIQTAEGALTEVHSMLNRMYELAEQSANGTYDDNTDRANLQMEMEALGKEIDRIGETANFNGKKLFDPNDQNNLLSGNLSLAIGEDGETKNQLKLFDTAEDWGVGVSKDIFTNGQGLAKTGTISPITKLSMDELKIKVDASVATTVDTSMRITTASDAQTALGMIKDAITMVSAVRGQLGAYQNRLEHTINNLGVMQENIQDAESTIRDTDVAAEMMKYTKNSVLVQSAQAMLAQANQQPQGVLQLLQ